MTGEEGCAVSNGKTETTNAPWHHSNAMKVSNFGDVAARVIGECDDPCRPGEKCTFTVAKVFGGLKDDKETATRYAKLISAAPEMAEALKGVLRVADRKTVEFDAARAALAKAGVL